MKLVLLGTNGAGPSEDGHTVCCMLPELGIVLDAGTGLFRIADHLQTSSLDIFLTHAHSDHIMGLTDLQWVAFKTAVAEIRLKGKGETPETILKQSDDFLRTVTIHSTEGILAAVHERFGKWSDVNWNVLSDQQTIAGDGVLTYFPVNHTSECIGFRLDWQGHSIAYVTDTIADPDLPYVQSLHGVDVLLQDCYLPDSWAEFAKQIGHGYTSGVATVAEKAQVARLILIHHGAAIGLKTDDVELARARAIFPNTEIGFDRMEITF